MIINNQMVSGILAFYIKLCVTADTEQSYFGGKCAFLLLFCDSCLHWKSLSSRCIISAA